MRTIFFGLLLTSLACAQESLTVTASRSPVVQPDQVVFGITFTSGFNMGLDDVLATLSGSGITAGNLVSVNSYTTQLNPSLQWTFRLPVPFSKINETITVLNALRNKFPQNPSSPSFSFSAGGVQVSPELQAMQQCPIADLIADARAQAQRMVSGTGVTVGPILALSDGGAAVPVQNDAAYVIPASRVGLVEFSGLLTGFAGFFLGPPNVPTTCTIVVKFGALPSQ